MDAHTLETEEDDRDGIRPYRPSDLKQVQFLIGAGVMEQLAATNKLAYSHPLTILAWASASASFIHTMSWWPLADNWLTWFQPVFACIMIAIPIMIGLEWIHRGHFESLLRTTLGLQDLASIQDFYSLSPASSFFVYSHRSAIIGCIAIDAARPSEDLESLLTSKSDPKATHKAIDSKGTSSAVLDASGSSSLTTKNRKGTASGNTSTRARIRHFHVDLLYRRATTSSDLLQHALEHTWNASKSVEEVFAIDSPAKQSIGAALRKEGFVKSSEGPKGWKGEMRKVGVFGLAERWVRLGRK